jgi:small GTP-binding protein
LLAVVNISTISSMLSRSISPTMFEIRVAVIGYVSVGKTTLINALFGKEYGEVAMKRTTAVVNSFRISMSTGNEGEPHDDSVVSERENEESEVISKKLSASVTLEETKADNAAFRSSDIVQEPTFDIALPDPLHKMRPDTTLSIVDIPGINEAGASAKYKDYVDKNWHTFDVVVLVMDARQGVNTDEQLDLLELAKNNLETSKSLPLIVLCNKVDDPDDEEQAALLAEARTAI